MFRFRFHKQQAVTAAAFVALLSCPTVWLLLCVLQAFSIHYWQLLWM